MDTFISFLDCDRANHLPNSRHYPPSPSHSPISILQNPNPIDDKRTKIQPCPASPASLHDATPSQSSVRPCSFGVKTHPHKSREIISPLRHTSVSSFVTYPALSTCAFSLCTSPSVPQKMTHRPSQLLHAYPIFLPNMMTKNQIPS